MELTDIHLMLLLMSYRRVTHSSMFDSEVEQLCEHGYMNFNIAAGRYLLTNKGEQAIKLAVEASHGA